MPSYRPVPTVDFGDQPAAQAQYVVVLSQEQLGQLVGRPEMRQVNPAFGPSDVARRYRRLKRAVTAFFVALCAIGGGGTLWYLGPEPVMASVFPWSGSAGHPVLSTGAGYSVAMAVFESRDQAGRAAARARQAGLPTFTRRAPGEHQVYQSMVGPYASLAEARRAQRTLGRLGFPSTRLLIDESLSSPLAAGLVAEPPPDTSAPVLLGAPGRLSLAFELPVKPQRVNSRRTTASAYDIDLGPVPSLPETQAWTVPDGIHLLHRVSLSPITTPDGERYLRARLELPEFARTSMRSDGRMVYVDLTWPTSEGEAAPFDVVATPENAPRIPVSDTSVSMAAAAAVPGPDLQTPGIPAPGPEPATLAEPTAPSAPDGDAYREAMAPVYRRLTEMRPFLLSSAETGDASVLMAMSQALALVASSVDAVAVPAEDAPRHARLAEAIRLAREALEPTFAGDRLARVYQAVGLVDATGPTALTAVP